MSATVNFRIEEEQKNELQRLAEQQDVKISELLRVIVTNYIEHSNFIDQYDSDNSDEFENSEDEIINNKAYYDPITGVTTIYIDSPSTCNEIYSL